MVLSRLFWGMWQLWRAECETPTVQPWVFRKEKMLKGKWEGPSEKGFCFLCVINCSSLHASCSLSAFTGDWGLILLQSHWATDSTWACSLTWMGEGPMLKFCSKSLYCINTLGMPSLFQLPELQVSLYIKVSRTSLHKIVTIHVST